MHIQDLLSYAVEKRASDLHIAAGEVPALRIDGEIRRLNSEALGKDLAKRLVYSVMSDKQKATMVKKMEIDFSIDVPNLSRFRVNAFARRGGVAAVFRVIPGNIIPLAELKVPQILTDIANYRKGLVLVTGPTGSGKTTTLAAMLDHINRTRRQHILTIEDPIEFVHTNAKSLVSQREIGPHAKDFKKALRAAVREDPDVILVGELRDLETIEMALAAAETGLLVFGTLHTNSASKTIDRVINVFPTERQDGVRGVLGGVLKAVVAQQLLRRKKGGRVAALEVLFGSSALASLIRQGKTHQIPGMISSGAGKGMVSMDKSLHKLIEDDIIDPLAGLEKALNKDEFRAWMKERGMDVPDSDD